MTLSEIRHILAQIVDNYAADPKGAKKASKALKAIKTEGFSLPNAKRAESVIARHKVN